MRRWLGLALVGLAACGHPATVVAVRTNHRAHVLPDGGRDLTDPPTTSTSTSSPAHLALPRASRSTTPRRSPAGSAAVSPNVGGDIYDQLAACESGGGKIANINPRAYNPAGPFYGAFQFLMTTWHNIGGQGDPRDHSYAEQKQRVVAGIPRSSWHRQFPSCSKQIGA